MKMEKKIIQLIQTALLAVPGKQMKDKITVIILTDLVLVITVYTIISLCGGMSDERWLRL
jgi:hypothetical protein